MGTAVGVYGWEIVVGGRTFGISAQQRHNLDRISLEGILQVIFNLNTNLSFLLEKHNPIISKRFKLIIINGAGCLLRKGRRASYKDEG